MPNATHATPAFSQADVNRFWSKVAKSDTCWLWRGAPNNTGYGVFGFTVGTRNTSTSAHRAAYLILVGPIQDGLHLDHLCKVRLCVNPDHLEPVTVTENNRRTMPTHCRQGHEYTPENTKVYQDDGGPVRWCLTCKRASNRRAAARRRELLRVG